VTLYINSLVEDLSLSCEKILFPYLLDMNQGVLALAKENVLERRDRNQIFF